MLPKEIKEKRFTSVGKGGYKATEVDEFLKLIYDDYVSILNNNMALKQRLEQCARLIDEYNEKKKSIASVLIDAQTNAQKQIDDAGVHAAEIMRKASEEAEELLILKKTEADAYYYEKTHAATQAVADLQEQIDELGKRYEVLLQQYIQDAEKIAAEIIEKAKNDAAAIVAAAYDDAKTARETADLIIGAANDELDCVMEQVVLFKKRVSDAIGTISPALDKVRLPVRIEQGATEVEITYNVTRGLPAFSFDGPTRGAPLWVDVSSDSKDDSDDVLSTDLPTTDSQDIVSHSEKKATIPDAGAYVSKIFDDSDDEVPLSFSYEGDFDSIVSDTLQADGDSANGEDVADE